MGIPRYDQFMNESSASEDGSRIAQRAVFNMLDDYNLSSKLGFELESTPRPDGGVVEVTFYYERASAVDAGSSSSKVAEVSRLNPSLKHSVESNLRALRGSNAFNWKVSVDKEWLVIEYTVA